MGAQPAAGGGRWVAVGAARLDRWLTGFAERHGAFAAQPAGDALRLAAPDGACALLHPPAGLDPPATLDALRAALAQPPPLGLILARRGAVAVAVVDGTALTRTKVDTHYVQGRTAAGGWSQQRFARRRENQARAAVAAAAEVAARVLLPEADRLAAVVCGGDRRVVDSVLADRRLAPLAARRHPHLLDVPEPRHATLAAAAETARAVRVLVREPAG